MRCIDLSNRNLILAKIVYHLHITLAKFIEKIYNYLILSKYQFVLVNTLGNHLH